MRRSTIAALALMLAAAGMPPAARAAENCSWPMYGRTLGRSMAQSDACSAISPLTVASLRPRWTFDTGAPVTAQPAVVDGVVYVGAADGVFYALPADAIGVPTPLWTFRVTDGNRDSYGKFASSPAVHDLGGRRLVVVGGGSTLYVLDAATGAELTSTCFDHRSDPAVRCKGSTAIIEIESSPAIVPIDDDTARVYVGMDFNEGGPGRAGIVALTLESGTEVTMTADWKFDPEALATYTSDVFTAGGPGQGCGNVWSSPAIDVENNLLYFDLGNCATNRYKNTALYGGEAVFAIDATTGALAWCYSPRPVNNDDLDFGASPNLLPGNRVGFGGKDGVYYAFPRTASGPPDTTPATACRGTSAHPTAWKTPVSTAGGISGITGTPAVGRAGAVEAVFMTNAVPMPDAGAFQNPGRLTTLHAVNTVTGAVLWDAPNPFPAYAGPVYANGVVYAPATFGMNFTAYDAQRGVPLWSFPMFAPSGPPAVVGTMVFIGSGVAPAGDTPVLSDFGRIYAFEGIAAP